MAPALPWLCIVCVVLGGTLGRASMRREFGLPSFYSSVYFEDLPVEKDQTVGEIQPKECEVLNGTESERGLHELKVVPRKFFSFFMKPEPSFKRLLFKLSLQTAFYELYSDEDLTLHAEDLTHPEGSQWTKVRVEHYKHERRGFDRHAFKISFGNKTVLRVTKDTWITKDFQDFTMFVEGGATLLFKCDPEDIIKPQVEQAPVPFSIWMMAVLTFVTAFLLAALCCVWVCLECQRKKCSTSDKFPMYDEFDEEVLERVRQKVEALRNGKQVVDPDTVVISYPPRKENLYVVDLSGYGGTEGVRPEDHQYEDIEKYYEHLNGTDNVYCNLDDDVFCGSAVDNIYESLPSYEDCEKERDEGRRFARY